MRKVRAYRVLCSIPRMAFPSTNRLAQVYDSFVTGSPQPFDANLHNAIQEVENTTVASGTIVQVLQDGYMIHDRLLRPSMVIVSRGGPKRETSATSGTNSGVNTTA